MRLGAVVAVVVWLCAWAASAAWAVTPGWECVPATAGKPVVSGGTGFAPSCASGTTAVLAPTFVSSGVGGKATVRFSAVNVQILNGAGSTTTVNGEGNLVLGYDESPGPQTGSHDLVLGNHQKFSSYGGIIAGRHANALSGPFADVFGFGNTAAASESSVTGGLGNAASGTYSTVGGGDLNTAGGSASSISGGCNNLTGPGTPSGAGCGSVGVESILGGYRNTATGASATVGGGTANSSSGVVSSVSGGEFNLASDPISSIVGGCDNLAGSGTVPSSFCSNNGVEAILGGVQNEGLRDEFVGGGRCWQHRQRRRLGGRRRHLEYRQQLRRLGKRWCQQRRQR